MFHQTLPFLLICLIAGIASKKWQLLPQNAYTKINQFILYITIPAITLEKISQLVLEVSYILPILSAWIIFLIAGLLFAVLAYFYKWDKKTWAALTLVCGLGNTSFVGFPVTELIFGDEGVKYAILVDQPGTFAALSTLGIAVAAYGNSSGITVRKMLWRLLKFPAFSCFFIALLLPAELFHYPLFNQVNSLSILHYIGSWTFPLAFLSIGMQFTFSFNEVNLKQFGWGLTYKLIFAPLFIFLAFRIANLQGLLYDVTILELAMPPMITASIIAVDHDLQPRLSTALINYGMPISAVTLYLWALIL